MHGQEVKYFTFSVFNNHILKLNLSFDKFSRSSYRTAQPSQLYLKMK